MNQLSLQVTTWSLVSTAVSTAVWLALLGDAALLRDADRASRLAAQARSEASRPIRPVVYHPAMQPRADVRAPVSLVPGPVRTRPQS